MDSIYRLIIDYVPNRLGLDYLPGPDDVAKSVGCLGRGVRARYVYCAKVRRPRLT